MDEILYKILRIFNLNYVFRKYLHKIRYVNYFYVLNKDNTFEKSTLLYHSGINEEIIEKIDKNNALYKNYDAIITKKLEKELELELDENVKKMKKDKADNKRQLEHIKYQTYNSILKMVENLFSRNEKYLKNKCIVVGYNNKIREIDRKYIYLNKY